MTQHNNAKDNAQNTTQDAYCHSMLSLECHLTESHGTFGTRNKLGHILKYGFADFCFSRVEIEK
jgi:hypothetical protein